MFGNKRGTMVREWRPVSRISAICLTLVFYREHIQLTPLSLTMSATNPTTLAKLASHIANAGTGIASCLTELRGADDLSACPLC